METFKSHEIAEQLTFLAAALSSEEPFAKVLDRIVDGCMSLSHADGVTLYTTTESDPSELVFAILRNRSLNLDKKPENLPPLKLHDEDGNASKLVAAQTFLSGKTIMIDDAYHCSDYDFSGTKEFDRTLGYCSTSFLCIPLRDHEGETIGVIQLINALNPEGEVVPFNQGCRILVESLASMAATVLTRVKLIESQRQLFEGFIKLLARTIDYKSPVTGKHCEHVPEIAMMLAEAVQHSDSDTFSEITFSNEEMYELQIAAWLHDCGKIITPEHIIDKGTKLHCLFDRSEMIENRADTLRFSWHLKHAQGTLSQQELEQLETTLLDDLAFLKQLNIGGEWLEDSSIARLDQIAQYKWLQPDGSERTLITPEEHQLLAIRRGTLNDAERTIMRDHIKVTLDMLHSISYPKHLQQVPDIAGNHHEHLDGSGYPRGLKADQLSLRARIMCIADIFEALTSPDRPYKEGMLLSQTLNIMGKMVENNHLDPQLFSLFVRSGTYRKYAETHMAQRQIDEVDIETLPGLVKI